MMSRKLWMSACVLGLVVAMGAATHGIASCLVPLAGISASGGLSALAEAGRCVQQAQTELMR